MAYPATVYRVMIASPDDVEEERKIAREIIFGWNSIHSDSKQFVLFPLGWEWDAYPIMGEHPQDILNKELLENSDVLVGVFNTKLGTPTKKYTSGTVEEIERHIDAGKPVLLYFSEADIKRQGFDQEQLNKLEEFKTNCKDRGLYNSFKDADDFKEKFTKHLQMIVNKEEYFENEKQLTDIDKLDISNLLGTNEEELKEEAVIILKEAAEYGEGTFTKHDDLSGWLTIQVKDKVIMETKENRVVAKWKKAVEQLVTLDMVEDVKYNGYRYNILDAGYEYLENNNLLVG